MPAFIETQFPISRLSAESYKERKANNGQTLTRLGKWWGRKPLILVRASIVGMLMPASNNPKRDREIFLKILTMDDAGTLARWREDKRFKCDELQKFATTEERDRWSQLEATLSDARELVKKIRIISKSSAKQDSETGSRARVLIDEANAAASACENELETFIQQLQIKYFSSLPYAERIKRCVRPEHVDGPSAECWAEINTHLGTSATQLSELIVQLGQRTFGHTPRVGDAFCGGGSIPFEAARIGCTSFGSDLNPIASLLAWAGPNLLGARPEIQEDTMRTQAEAFRQADQTVVNWRIEHNDKGERADAYLYCVEVKPEGWDYYIPLAPSWLIGEKSRVVCRWHRVPDSDRLQPEIAYVSINELDSYKSGHGATVVDGWVIDPFDPKHSWSIESLRGPGGLRSWDFEEFIPRPDDVFQERLYCIRWVKTIIGPDGRESESRRYAAPDVDDLIRESHALKLLCERRAGWQNEGFLPSNKIVAGYNTDQPHRERGWTYWHHLFTPRQLLTHGLLAEASERVATSQSGKVCSILGLLNLANWNSRLSCWLPQATNEKGNNTFYNQSLNTFYNYSVRPMLKIGPTWTILESISNSNFFEASHIESVDARDVTFDSDLWITDPPYADAVNYHELGDFFLAWCDKRLSKTFPGWPIDARAELAVRGNAANFRTAMVDIYKNLTRRMAEGGLQMVQFTHQDPTVWADLGMILWASGLSVTAAWTISTESDAGGFKVGNYVQGTVCLILRKRASSEAGFLDEVFPLVEDEVKRQIDSMQALDEGGEPNFNDADYQLAAYAAALKVLTQYGAIDGRDVEHEVFAVRERGQKSDFQAVIERALGIACDYLIPRGLDAAWRELSLVERYYLRALDIESRGERRKGMYEELARGFGVTDIKPLLKADKANGATLHTPSGLEAGLLTTPSGAAPSTDLAPVRRGRGRSGAGAPHPFASSSLRHLLFAIRETAAADQNPEPGRQYLRDTYGPGIYWQHRERFLVLLEWLSGLGNIAGMEAWTRDSTAARLLAGRLRNDEA